MTYLIEDCLRIIVTKLQNDSSSLYSCILVNRFWCRMTIPILWKNPLAFKNISHDKFYTTIINMLPTSSIKFLVENNIVLPSPIISRRPLFNYLSFLSQILPEQEIYKLFINNYFQCINSLTLNNMAQTCQNIGDLKLLYCNGNNPGLIMLVDAQKNLKSLLIYFKGGQKQCTQLSEVIERKAGKLTKLIIKPSIAPISPKFLLSLKYLKHLELNNDHGYEYYNEGKEMQEWRKYLSIVSFPELQYLKISYLPNYDDYKLIEKSHQGLLEINICRRYEYQDSVYTSKLIKAIAKYCPKIKKLAIDVELENLDEIREMLLNCPQLKTIDLSAINEKQIICDKLLEIIIDFSPKSLYKFSFNGYWIFSVESLQTFFENWRNKFPIKFYISFSDESWVTEEYGIILKKYLDEGIIKRTNFFC
ncbi:hypothetical protein GLOIN_2v1511704 [Rhizophagus irregularis DAOM 181602=DAOM 197198]|nr:hypothetical protein GLOIN_2v1511704 [Rhizophagus irregularis DAOM 181602=DAOM 197198]